MLLFSSTWTKCRKPAFYVPIVILIALLYLLNTVEVDYLYSINLRTDMKFKQQDSGFFVKTVGCRIPFLEPFDKTVIKFVTKVKQFNCSAVPSLVNSNLNTLHVDETLLNVYNISNVTNQYLNCSYQAFSRRDPKSNEADNLYDWGPKIYFNFSVVVKDEFVKVTCTVNQTKKIYEDFHAFVPVKRVKNIKKSGKKLNVLIIGIDSISRLNLERQLPQTKLFITKKLRAVEMIGYNKVGDNTFPNLIPILTGKTIEELTDLCWKNSNTKFDKCPFLWKNYSGQGYLTAYAEDSSWMGLFNYQRRGFQAQPTDYYWRTFNYLAEKQLGHYKPYNAHLCIGPRETYKVLGEYVKKFIVSLKSVPYFGFFWSTSLSHDNLNYPSLGDNYYEELFKYLKDSKTLNNTVLIFLSDHGMRWGDIRSTHQGHLEERLPFLFFAFPTWFSKLYPTAVANLKRNSRRLTTPFDLHETLADLLNPTSLITDAIKKRSRNLSNQTGISLFLNIPENRTCLTAGITAHWCTCQKSTEIDKNSTIVIQAANFTIDFINKQLEGYKSCTALHLDSILDSRLQTSNDYLKNNSTINDYTVILKTEPGAGLFESTVRCIHCNDKNDFQMTGTISRLNLYGNQSACITDFHLKLYCYCGS